MSIATTRAPGDPPDFAGQRSTHSSALHVVNAGDEPVIQGPVARADGKLTARQRIQLLVDEGSFCEVGGMHAGGQTPASDGVVIGFGQVHGGRIFVFSQDFSVMGGTIGTVHARRIKRIIEMATEARCPVVGLYDGGGARIQEGAGALHGCGQLFERIVRSSGVIPQISVVLGPCAGAAAYAPVLTDFVFMVEGSGMMFLTGPDVVRRVTGETISAADLGGAKVHGELTGVASLVYQDEESCLQDVRYLLSLLPSSSSRPPEVLETDDDPHRDCSSLRAVVPADPRRPYDVHDIIGVIADSDTWIEIHSQWAANIVCGFARLAGMVVGFVANQPVHRAGVIDISASEKAARFVRTCDAFHIPLITLVDVPGFMPGSDQEHKGVIRHGAKLLYAYCEATVPRIQVIMRKAYGGAYIVMDSPSVGSDLSYAWPGNEVAVMGAAAAVDIIHRREIAGAIDPQRRRTELEDQYAREHLAPTVAAGLGLVDEVIDPARTRAVLIEGLQTMQNKHRVRPDRKHGIGPL